MWNEICSIAEIKFLGGFEREPGFPSNLFFQSINKYQIRQKYTKKVF
jgi:hypothetical protein